MSLAWTKPTTTLGVGPSVLLLLERKGRDLKRPILTKCTYIQISLSSLLVLSPKITTLREAFHEYTYMYM